MTENLRILISFIFGIIGTVLCFLYEMYLVSKTRSRR